MRYKITYYRLSKVDIDRKKACKKYFFYASFLSSSIFAQSFDSEPNSDRRFEFLWKLFAFVSQIIQNRIFYATFKSLRFLDCGKAKIILKNIQTKIIDLNFIRNLNSRSDIGSHAKKKKTEHGKKPS